MSQMTQDTIALNRLLNMLFEQVKSLHGPKRGKNTCLNACKFSYNAAFRLFWSCKQTPRTQALNPVVMKIFFYVPSAFTWLF